VAISVFITPVRDTSWPTARHRSARQRSDYLLEFCTAGRERQAFSRISVAIQGCIKLPIWPSRGRGVSPKCLRLGRCGHLGEAFMPELDAPLVRLLIALHPI
jgi:hypothetical protein